MTNAVHTGPFYILEGLSILEGEVACLAVCFDLKTLSDFIIAFAKSERETKFDCYRITGHDGLDAILAASATATHPAPLTSN